MECPHFAAQHQYTILLSNVAVSEPNTGRKRNAGQDICFPE